MTVMTVLSSGSKRSLLLCVCSSGLTLLGRCRFTDLSVTHVLLYFIHPFIQVMAHAALPHGHTLGFRVQAGARVWHSLARQFTLPALEPGCAVADEGVASVHTCASVLAGQAAAVLGRLRFCSQSFFLDLQCKADFVCCFFHVL